MYDARGNSVNGNYLYDGNLKRVKTTINGKVVYNIFDTDGSLVYVKTIESGANKTTEYVSGPNGSLARITNSDVTYLQKDALGSAQAGTNIDANLQWR